MSHLKAAPLPVLAFTTRPADTEALRTSPKAKATAEAPRPDAAVFRREDAVFSAWATSTTVLRRRAQGRAPARHHADPPRHSAARRLPMAGVPHHAARAISRA